MKIPEEYVMMYETYLNQSARGVTQVTLSIDMVMALIEKIAELETDSKNLDSYIHRECRRKAQKMSQTAS